MRRDLWLVLILGCLLILLLEAPAAFSSVNEDLRGAYPPWTSLGDFSTSLERTPAPGEEETSRRAGQGARGLGS